MASNWLLLLCFIGLCLLSDVNSKRIGRRHRSESRMPVLPPPIKVPEQRGLYSIVAPGKLLPNSIYYVTISSQEAEVDTPVIVAIDDGEKDQIKVNDVVGRTETKILKIAVGDLNPYKSHTLIVSGQGAFNFNHTAKLQLEQKSVSIFIQTDKAMYKPSQKVMFRTVVVNEDLKPLKSQKVVTVIKDSNGNAIKKFNATTSVNGLLSQELQLSDQPVLGDWTISATLNNTKTEKKFTVAEYVLPSFNVDIQVPKFVVCNSPNFVATVKALYTYGKPVKGKMVFKIMDGHSSYVNGTYSKRVRFVLHSEINGERDVEIETANFAYECRRYSTKIDFEVSVVDKLTGKSYNQTKSLTIYDKKYKFRLLKSHKFKSGFDYVDFIKVTYPDDTPVENTNKSLQIRYGHGYSKYRRDTKVFEVVPVNGIAKIVLDTKYTPMPTEVHDELRDGSTRIWYPYPRYDDAVISLEATYDGVESTVGSIYADKDECFSDLHIFNEEFDKTYNVGDEITFEVTTDNAMHNFVYEVVGRKGVILAHSFDEPITQIVSFTLNITRKYAPKANIVIHFFCNKKIIDKSLTIKVDGFFKNKPHVSANKTDSKPGKMVKLNLDAKPHSSIAILGYDRRMALLKSGNDIEKENVVSEINKQLGCKGSEHFSSCVTSFNHWYHWNYLSSRSSFHQSGLIHFTNIKEPNHHWPTYPRFHMMASPNRIAGGGGIMPMAMNAPVARTNAVNVPATEQFHKEVKRVESRFTKKSEDVKVRQHFPETWIFEVIDTNETGKASIDRKIPDTITSWYIASFAINKKDGFGLVESPAVIKVFRPFFIKLSLPYSVIRGETVSVPVTVYNYANTVQITEVTLENKGDFEFVVAESELNEVSFSTQSKTKTITLPANDGVTHSFLIKPKKISHLEIKVVAISDSASDAVSEKLLVKPEGDTVFKNKAVFVNLKANEKVVEVINVDIPNSSVPDSQRVTVIAIGDILGPAINNLDDLLRMPYGCGEQNMINFVPNIVVLDYLAKSGKLNEKIKSKAISHIESGYQRELTYQHDDGSYSAFGNSDAHGSTWLTAYVHKSFMQAKNYINIDDKVTDKSLQFLLSTQNDDGSFRENGRVLHKAMQSKSSENSVSLTAFVFIALNTNAKHNSDINDKLQRTEAYLIKHLDNASDIYEVMITSYALQLHNSLSKDLVLKKLKSVSRTDAALTFWSTDDKAGSTSIEMTAYGLMTIMLNKDITAALPVLRYLISKQNSNGGFSSTQDTVIALQALASFAKDVQNSDPSLKVEVKSDENSDHSVEVNAQNSIVLQEVLLSPKTKKVTLTATGEGSAIMQVSWKYNVANVTTKPSFDIRYIVDKSVPENTLKMTVFTKYLKSGASGMTVMEATLPSGYVADVEALHDLKKSGVKRVETKNENTVIVVYFDEITEEETSVKLTAMRKTMLAGLKPVPITVYDYYDKSKTATIFYTPRQASLCDICEGENCGKSCVPEE